MIEFFLKSFSDSPVLVNLLGYISIRSIMAGMSALLLSLFLGRKTIKWLNRLHFAQTIRQDGPQTHLQKQGTPTMGGILIIFCTSFSILLWMKIDSVYVWLCLVTFLIYGGIGFWDDWRKIKYKNSKGISKKQKFTLQFIFGLIVGMGIYLLFPEETKSYQFPFFKDVFFELGVFFIIITAVMISGFSNAVNLTDGLDGLVIMPVMLISAALGIFAYLTGHIELANYLYIPYYAGVGEISVICAAVIGASLGFLWFNTYPAEMFMGDVGSLALGALLSVIAVLLRQEVIFLIMAGVFVLEALSVMIQVPYFKMTQKRVFLMAPIHHHFELKGLSEPKIIVRFWIVTAIFVMIGLASLKIR